MNIASIMSTVLPGTFAPDMKDAEAPSISSIPGLDSDAAVTSEAAGSLRADGGAVSFKDTVKKMLSDVNDSMNTSDQNTRDLATGKTNDINKVVTSVEEANLALQYTLAIRSKLMDAYSEIDRISV